jgi:diguanylate cyclase (GGDEF)-like protein
MRARSGDSRTRYVPAGLSVVVLASAVASGDVASWGAFAASAAIAVVAVRRGTTVLAGQLLPFAVSIALLGVCGAGLDQSEGVQGWQSVVAVGAYPFLARALRGLVTAHRRVRDADVLVEAALVGTAVGIVLHVVLGSWRDRTIATAWGDAAGALPAMLVALDVALLVIGARSLRTRGAWRGPLGILHVGLTLLLLAHLWQEVQSSQARAGGALGSVLAVLALLALGAAAVHPASATEPLQPLDQPKLFSTSHAAIVVVALLAAPVVLVVQAVREVAASATVATGATISGAILAGYLVGLLRERADTELQATHDALTGLPNRTLVVDRLERAIAHARRGETSCAVLFVDLDRFKDINDTFGHAAGDELLEAVASRLTRCVRDEDTVARLSGDEFVLLLPHLDEPELALDVARRILDALGTPMTVAGERMLVAGSIGIATYPADGATPEALLESADAAMYRAKEAPGNSWEVFSGQMATDARERLRTESALLDGIGRGELVLHYQPVVDLVTGRTIGAEALMRWQHPERGLLPPSEFIPIAERSDLIVTLGEWAIFEACRELRRWRDLGFGGMSIAVNASTRQFGRGLTSTVSAALRATGANPEDLVVELTESTIVDDTDAVAETLTELRQLGVRSAIDDFGTGYCGLRYLSALPVASLKIDRSFVQTMTPSGAAIVAATIAMGKSLGLTLVAEGVETPEQQRFLASQGCERAQGYLFGRPMPADDLVDRLRSERGVAGRQAVIESHAGPARERTFDEPARREPVTERAGTLDLVVR